MSHTQTIIESECTSTAAAVAATPEQQQLRTAADSDSSSHSIYCSICNMNELKQQPERHTAAEQATMAANPYTQQPGFRCAQDIILLQSTNKYTIYCYTKTCHDRIVSQKPMKLAKLKHPPYSRTTT